MAVAEKISVTMTSDMLSEIRESVRAGDYASTSEALRDAVRLWRQRRREDTERLDALRARVRRSIDDPRTSLSEEEVEARLNRLFEEAVEFAPDAAT
jgi:antitoxin ParD1/3/4